MVGSPPGAYRPGKNRKIAHLSGTKKVGSVEHAHMGWKKLFLPAMSFSYSQDRNAAVGMILEKNTEFCSFLHVCESVLSVSKGFLGQS